MPTPSAKYKENIRKTIKYFMKNLLKKLSFIIEKCFIHRHLQDFALRLHRNVKKLKISQLKNL